MLRALRQLSLDVPRDLAVAGFDNEPWTELAGPGITVIEQPVYDIGRMAMAMLQERLAQPTLPTRRVLLTCTGRAWPGRRLQGGEGRRGAPAPDRIAHDAAAGERLG